MGGVSMFYRGNQKVIKEKRPMTKALTKIK